MEVNLPRSSFDVNYLLEGQIYRLYYIIDNNETSSKVESYVAKLKENGLEIIDITETERNNFELPSNFKGHIVFVQKHEEDDPDYTPGTHPGFDAQETFLKIKNIWKEHFKSDIQFSPEAATHLDAFINKADFAIDVTPAFNGVHNVLNELQKDNETEVTYTEKDAVRNDSKQALIVQLEEILLAIEEKRNNIKSYKTILPTLKGTPDYVYVNNSIIEENKNLKELNKKLDQIQKQIK